MAELIVGTVNAARSLGPRYIEGESWRVSVGLLTGNSKFQFGDRSWTGCSELTLSVARAHAPFVKVPLKRHCERRFNIWGFGSAKEALYAALSVSLDELLVALRDHINTNGAKQVTTIQKDLVKPHPKGLGTPAKEFINAPVVKKLTLLVAPLQSKERDKENAESLGELIRIQVGRSKRFTLVTPEEMDAIDEELKRQLSGGCEESSCIAEIGGALGARFMISGKFMRIGKRYILTLKLIDIELVKAVSTDSIKANSTDTIVDLLDAKVETLLAE